MKSRFVKMNDVIRVFDRINAIFVYIKAGGLFGFSPYELFIELLLKITKIVTNSTHDETEIDASALFFIQPV